jgi:hypothetical protein
MLITLECAVEPRRRPEVLADRPRLGRSSHGPAKLQVVQFTMKKSRVQIAPHIFLGARTFETSDEDPFGEAR